jgi:hypothetical protein
LQIKTYKIKNKLILKKAIHSQLEGIIIIRVVVGWEVKEGSQLYKKVHSKMNWRNKNI